MHKSIVAGFAALLLLAAHVPVRAQDTLKVAVGQRGNWDTSVRP